MYASIYRSKDTSFYRSTYLHMSSSMQKAARRYLFIDAHGSRPYMLNTRNEETNTAFYSYLACFVNILALNM